jgi:guanylate kinase
VIREALARGQDLVLEIDWQGAQQVRKLHPECIGVFILPPSVAELERRMRARGQDADAVIKRRLASAEDEMSHAPEFDYVIINKDFDEARRDLQAIIRVERLRKARTQ